MRRVVSLWLPFWATDRLRRHDATLPVDVPLVTRTHDGHRRVIAAACPVASRRGLRTGMPLAHAQAVEPDLVVVDATPAEDTAALRELAAWCLRFSPLTAADPPDGIWVDVTGCTHLHGGEEPTLRLLLGHLVRCGVQGRAAVADTPGTAHALARFGASPVMVAGVGAAVEALAPLPVAALRIDGQIVAGLRRLGLDRVGQVMTTARGPLAHRFGPELLLRLDQALGRVREAIEPVLPPEAVAVRREFVEPISTPEAICTVIPVLVTEACAVLERRGEGARRLDLAFERVDGTVQVVRIGTAKPVRSVRHLARLLDERIEEVDPGLGIEVMRLVLPSVEPLHPSQDASGLGGDEIPDADLSELVDRLLNRLGAGRVYRLGATESDVPERSQQALFDLSGNGELLRVPAQPDRYGGHSLQMEGALSADGRLLALCLRPGEILIIDVETGRLHPPLRGDFAMVRQLDFLPDSRRLLVTEQYGRWSLRCLDIGTGLADPDWIELTGIGMAAVAVDPPGRRVAVARRGTVSVHGFGTDSPPRSFPLDHVVKRCAMAWIAVDAVAVRTDHGCASIYALP